MTVKNRAKSLWQKKLVKKKGKGRKACDQGEGRTQYWKNSLRSSSLQPGDRKLRNLDTSTKLHASTKLEA